MPSIYTRFLKRAPHYARANGASQSRRPPRLRFSGTGACTKHSKAEIQPQPPTHPPQLVFDTEDAERFVAQAGRAANDGSLPVETSRLLKNMARVVYCSLVDRTQRAAVRVAAALALDRVSHRVRHFDPEADIEDTAQETICDVTLLANSAETDEQIELRRNSCLNHRSGSELKSCV